ncbi:hypothetical protein XHV734_1392 [Xanthomonas hortorum pv. vitians]|nr:hypothetical protein XHV734_1392 [Xanthomonas hortorum pv. vitians]
MRSYTHQRYRKHTKFLLAHHRHESFAAPRVAHCRLGTRIFKPVRLNLHPGRAVCRSNATRCSGLSPLRRTVD